MTDTEPNVAIDIGKYQLGWSDEEDYVYKPQKGLNEDIIREMSFLKKEPEWMLDFRLRSYEIFKQKPMPNWGGDTRLVSTRWQQRWSTLIGGSCGIHRSFGSTSREHPSPNLGRCQLLRTPLLTTSVMDAERRPKLLA